MSRKKRPPRTNATRLLDARGVSYEVISFSPTIHSAAGVAEEAGLDPHLVFKTLVVCRERGKPLLVMVPGDERINLKALAASLGEKRVRMAAHHEAEKLTGLQVGGISALALVHKSFDVYIDLAARDLAEVVVSAGRRGVNVRLAVSDLIRVTNAAWVDATGRGDAGGEAPWAGGG